MKTRKVFSTVLVLVVAALVLAPAMSANAVIVESDDFTTIPGDDMGDTIFDDDRDGQPLTLDVVEDNIDLYKTDNTLAGSQGTWGLTTASKAAVADGESWTVSFDVRLNAFVDTDDDNRTQFTMGYRNDPTLTDPGYRFLRLDFQQDDYVSTDTWGVWASDAGTEYPAVSEGLPVGSTFVHIDLVANRSVSELTDYNGTQDLAAGQYDVWINGELGISGSSFDGDWGETIGNTTRLETAILRINRDYANFSYDNFKLRDEAYVVAASTAVTWDNDGGGGNLQWETGTNWDPAGEPDATSLCTIDNGDTVDLSEASELAFGIKLGETTATTLNVSGDLTVTTATNVYANGTLNVSGTLTTTSATLGAETITYEGGALGFTLTGTDLGDKTVARTVGILGDTVTIAGATVDMAATDLNVSASTTLLLEPTAGDATLGDLAMDDDVALTMEDGPATVNLASISGGTSIDTGGSAIVITGSVSPDGPTMATAAAGTITWDINGSQAITTGSATAGETDVLKSGDTFSVDNGIITGTAGAGILALNAWGPNPIDDPVVDGITFTDTNFWGDLNETSPVSTVLGGGTTGDSEYDILIANLDRTDVSGFDSATYTLTGLTDAKDYVVQVWYADDRQTTRAMTFDGTNPITLLAADWEYGNGIFTADGTTQDLSITSNDTGKVHISGVQVREYTSAATGYLTPSIGSLTVNNTLGTASVTIDTGGALLTEVSGNTTDVSARSDLLAVDGDLTMGSDSIQLDWVAADAVEDGDWPTTPEDEAARAVAMTSKFGGAYTIATYTGSLTGTPTVNTNGSIGTAYVDTVDNTAGVLTVTLYDLGDGDTNIDGVVNSLDLSDFGQGWGSSSPTWANGDFNFDGVVNSLDLSAFGQAWGWSAASAGATGTNPVPEPGTIVMLLIGAAGVLLYRKRR